MDSALIEQRSNSASDGITVNSNSSPLDDIEMGINSPLATSSPTPGEDEMMQYNTNSIPLVMLSGSQDTMIMANPSSSDHHEVTTKDLCVGYNPWLGIIDAIPKLRHIKTIDTNMEYGEDWIQIYDWVDGFQNNLPFLLHLMMLAFIPSMPRLTNLTLGKPSDFKYANKRITGTYTYPQSFFMIGSVTFSSLFKGEFNHAIVIKPLKNFWPRQASVLAEIMEVDFDRNLFSFKTVRDGLVFMTYPKPKDPSAPPTPIPLFNVTREFDPTKFHKCPPIKSELEEGTIALLIFTTMKYGDDVGSFNIQIVAKIHDPPAVTSGTIPAKPLPKYLTNLGDIGVLGEDFPELTSEDKEDPHDTTRIFLESLQPDNTFNNMAVNFSNMHTNRNSLPPPSPPSIALALGDAEHKKDISQLTNTPKEIVWSLGRPKHSNQAITSTFRVANTSTSLAEVLWLLDHNDLEPTDIRKAIFMLQAILNKMIEKQDDKKAD
ncbi:uncharacterized protein EV420DRAFT_1651273 [Desarmillaria tabescens]|uniref:Uncharacterized protein n=1 Tax=Armillaria tabescens TaxID=1929756 RepID=A0AA39ML47_ARMTA|nr:uncharacterized protein EV420DRAFT_1651273 [Desarmillaria tabescens]KAK0438856.1 hypothetical protein EV420DRAFT_1651273 [Desarmillaria tabescens]